MNHIKLVTRFAILTIAFVIGIFLGETVKYFYPEAPVIVKVYRQNGNYTSFVEYECDSVDTKYAYKGRKRAPLPKNHEFITYFKR